VLPAIEVSKNFTHNDDAFKVDTDAD